MARKTLPKTYADALAELRTVRKSIADYQAKKEKATERRDELIAHAASFAESSGGIIAKAAGVVPARVSQIAPVRKSRLQSAVSTDAAMRDAIRAGVIGSRTEPAEVPAPRKTNPVAAALAAAVGAPTELPGADEYAEKMQTAAERGPRELPGIGDVPVTVDPGASTGRKWTKQAARETITLHPDGRAFGRGKPFRIAPGDNSAASILAALPVEVQRVVMVGDPVWHTDADTTMTADVTAWLAAPLPAGWTHGSHFLHERHPVGRFIYTPPEGGRPRRVEIQHIGSWVPGTDADDPAVVWHAFRLLRDAVRQRWGTDTVELLGSPKTLAHDLWQRTIPQNTEYPLMSPELRDLIRTTSGQGRFELRVSHDAARGIAVKLPGLHYYDCTFAYAGLTWGMPVGVPKRITGREFSTADSATQQKMVRGRGRWHVKVTVPADWRHVGLLPASGMKGWEYPSEPGRTFTTWAGGSEIYLAMRQGWHVDVIDGITWAEGKPLNLWRDKLVECWQSLNAWGVAAGDGYRDAAALAAKMVRSVLLFGIGGFHSRGTQRRGIAVTEANIPAAAYRAEERDGVWNWEAGKQDTGDTAHPEWSAEIYSRMRARLLSGPQGVGALAVDASEVIAFRSDAMMLTRDTGWTNPDATPGRFRLKGSLAGEIIAPTNEAELLALRDAAEGAK